MKKHIIAIGGGGFGRCTSSQLIENYILSLSNKLSPNICFVPTATGDDDSYIVRFYSIFSRLKCNPSHIDFFKRTLDLEHHISNQDIVFVGGGNTKSMLGVWKEWGMDNILKNSYHNGTIMSGVSAGAICWFSNGITDSWDNELRVLPCLGFVKGTCCPHYDEEAARIPYVKKSIRDKTIKNCISIEGGAALHCIDGTPVQCVSFKENKNVYSVYSLDGVFIEKKYPVIQL